MHTSKFPKWVDVMDAKIKMIGKNGTWDLVPRLWGKNVIKSKV